MRINLQSPWEDREEIFDIVKDSIAPVLDGTNSATRWITQTINYYHKSTDLEN
jgi:hypothetical protein